MKTAISIPDTLFNKAEKAAHKLHISRSELYQTAIEQYVEGLSDEQLLTNLNNAYGTTDSTLDKSIQRLQTATIEKENTDESW